MSRVHNYEEEKWVWYWPHNSKRKVHAWKLGRVACGNKKASALVSCGEFISIGLSSKCKVCWLIKDYIRL